MPRSPGANRLPTHTIPTMPGETDKALKARAQKIFDALRTAYPDAHCELDYTTPLELLIATILSAQCTDKRVNIVTPALFKKYPTAAAIAAAPLPDLEEVVKSTGFYRDKAKNINHCCTALLRDHQGAVPASMEALTALPGVGRKTANVVLGNAFGINIGVVVDTHVGRLSIRLGLSSATDPIKVEQDLMKLAPQADWTMASHWLIWHGRRRCPARKPDCSTCEIRHLCPRNGLPA